MAANQPPPAGGPLHVVLDNQDKTRLDWRQALIIPLILAILGAGVAAGFGVLQAYYGMQLSADQQRETAINNYLSSMSTLLMNSDLRSATAKDGSDLRSLARAQTLTVLSELGNDGARKRRIVNFLHDANLINRGNATLQFPVVSLAGADLTRAKLSSIDLGGADLAQVDLTGADLSGADLMGADLDQAILTGANLKGAMLDYAQLVGANLSCAHQNNNCTDLTNADLSGADFVNADLAGVVYSNTDVSGTSPQGSFTQAIHSKNAYKTVWHVTLEHNTLKISYNRGDSISVYGILDTDRSTLQVIYGPLGNGGTSVVLFPAFWSLTSCPGDYCQYARVTGGTYTSLLPRDNSPIPGELQQNQPLTFTIVGTTGGLTVTDTIKFSVPDVNSIKVDVKASARSIAPITLDQYFRGTKNFLNREAFKPVLLTAMYDSASTWTAQQAVFGTQKPLQLNDTNQSILTPPQGPSRQTSFALIGGVVNNVTYSTISVTLNSLSALHGVTGAAIDLMSRASASVQMQQKDDPTMDNVSMWDGVDAPHSNEWSYPNQWSYTVKASIPYASPY